MAFRDRIRLALSCVTGAVLQVDTYRPSTTVFAATLNRGGPVSLGADLFFRIHLHCQVMLSSDSFWHAAVVAYFIEVTDYLEREIIAYHWHPEGRSAVTWPHMHLGPALGNLTWLSSHAHLPTGPVVVEDVVHLFITEFAVAPRRADWAAVLQRTRQLA